MKGYHALGKKKLLERVSNIQQLAGFDRYQVVAGKGKGNEVIQVRNGSGLKFDIYKDRAFDLGLCEYNGIPISWMSPNGQVAPAFNDKSGKEWERSFQGGLLTTCGLTYMGRPNQDQGESLGLHGRISSTPAKLLQTEGYWDEDEYYLVFRGEVRESTALGENIRLERKITTKLGSNQLHIQDNVTNESFLPVEHMVLYHFNFGYPLINESTSIHIPSLKRRWIHGEGDVIGWEQFNKPAPETPSTVMLHEEVEGDGNGNVAVSIESSLFHNGKEKQLFVTLTYDQQACPFLTQWKHQGSGKYVLGMEPGNTTTEGRGFHRNNGTLPFLQAFETKEYNFTIEFTLKED